MVHTSHYTSFSASESLSGCPGNELRGESAKPTLTEPFWGFAKGADSGLSTFRASCSSGADPLEAIENVLKRLQHPSVE